MRLYNEIIKCTCSIVVHIVYYISYDIELTWNSAKPLLKIRQFLEQFSLALSFSLSLCGRIVCPNFGHQVITSSFTKYKFWKRKKVLQQCEWTVRFEIVLAFEWRFIIFIACLACPMLGHTTLFVYLSLASPSIPLLFILFPRRGDLQQVGELAPIFIWFQYTWSAHLQWLHYQTNYTTQSTFFVNFHQSNSRIFWII